ncbi:MAG: hypothetical protein V4501_07595 [Pseudomonadota bacterium]
MKLIISLILALFATSVRAADCTTHESCALAQLCECEVPAYSFVDRFFYFDFPLLEKGHVYQCHFSDSLGIVMVRFDLSTFPLGTTWQLQTASTHTPVDFTVDTKDMDQASGKMIIKYFVPGGDMPTNVSGSCNLVS